MAAPSAIRNAFSPDPDPGRLLAHAVRLLVEHLVATNDRAIHWSLGPLVVVSSAEDAASAAIRDGRLADGIGDAADSRAWNGRDLDREIAKALSGERLDRLADSLASGRIVVVDRIDQIRDTARRRALVALFDVTVAAGVTWCVSLPRPADDEVGARLASRLRGGLVVSALRQRTQPASDGAPSLGRILRAAARHHDVAVTALSGPARSRTISSARSLAMYLARRLTGLSFQAIGAACGGRDHTTVLHGVRVCGGRIARDPAYAADVERLAAMLAAQRPVADAADRRRPGVGSAALGRALSGRRRVRRRRA